ncbi:MAG: molybdate ABC transporter permease subunit [Desulfomonilia bacterium]|jgi:molybdate transport system permease protein|uniref:Molybdenum transport system permease protein ModB n=1 Tax=anaerobic digester metagenome TaxID=1263854 RepID=A0A485LUM2_9ZZZZ|nr:molybdate ABC transporter permease subunit [Pseudomonadota bacterium]HON39688.1 molybdate ABC transporter permease subunit [Deltaproteobacteria bacterium]HRS55370.1 molybdate ABC transporter permease subunit [Desulfomonilia bacterium]HPD20439.1 molybdate ABC transporter permease subunit [Deltaproteobacteria bacterium]HPX18856.1 molybdate ABC transporter permease subunit [Deltaproteobacteria bacterium]
MDTGSILGPLWISFKLAAATTVVLLAAGSFLAYLLVYRKVPARAVVESLISLPIVLPPTVLGFYLLILMGPKGTFGRAWEGLFQSSLLFTFAGIVIASVISSLPFAVQPLKAAFAKIDRRILENAHVLGLSSLATFFRVVVPNSAAGFAAASILVFLHTMGEFGVILMVGGSIPGETKVASIAIFEAVESLRYRDAWVLSLVLALVSFSFLLVINALNKGEYDGIKG